MNEITSIEVGSNVMQLGDALCKDMTSLVSVDFSKCGAVDVLPPSGFMGCSGFKRIDGLTNLTAVGDCEFAGCSNLESVDVPENLIVVGTSAFADCAALSYVSRLADGDPDHTFDIVGDYAFAGTGIVSASLALRSSATQTFWGDECFAGCRNLERVDFLSSCYMSNGMFKDCTKLSQVNFLNDHTSYVCPYVFQNCTSLRSITLPSKLWYVSEGMFKDCVNLREVRYNPQGHSPMIDFVQKNAFSGCDNLELIVFPKSLTDVSQLEDGCLSNCMQQAQSRTLLFEGMGKEKFIHKTKYDVDITQGRVIAFDIKDIDGFKKYTSTLDGLQVRYCIVFNWKYKENVIGCDNDAYYPWTAPDILIEPIWWQDGIPQGKAIKKMAEGVDGVILFVSEFLEGPVGTINDEEWYGGPPFRPYTDAELSALRLEYAKKRFDAIKNKNWDYDILTYIYNAVFNNAQFKDAIAHTEKYAAMAITVNPALNQKNRVSFTTKATNLTELRDVCGMNDIEPSAAGKQYCSSFEWNDHILKTGMFRLNASCTLQFLYGQSSFYDYEKYKQYQQPYIEDHNPAVDYDAVAGFETGKWYYNARDLVQWVDQLPDSDERKKPVLVIYSLLGCKPCQIYEKKIWRNQDFQAWARKQNFYLCGMEVKKQTYYDPQYKYCVDDLLPRAENFQDADSSDMPSPNQFGETFRRWRTPDGGYNQDLNTPVLAFIDKNGSTWLYTYHFIDKWLKQVGVSGVIQCLKSLCLFHFDGNSLDGAKYTVDAGMPFSRYDYVYTEDNPYRISPTYKEKGVTRSKLPVVIDLLRWDKMASYEKTANGAKAAMMDVLSGPASDSAKYPEYIGNCLFTEFDWMTLTFSVNRISMLEKADADAINKLLGADMLRIKIGQDVYILQVDKNSAKKASTPCSSAPVALYKYKFVNSSMPAESEYREDDEPLG